MVGEQVDFSGKVVSIAETAPRDGSAVDATFRWAQGIAIDNCDGSMYVTDQGYLRKVSINGMLHICTEVLFILYLFSFMYQGTVTTLFQAHFETVVFNQQHKEFYLCKDKWPVIWKLTSNGMFIVVDLNNSCRKSE
jgi:hypothetical protein